MSPAPTARQQRARETRDRIFYAACELFLAHGYQGTSVDKIAARAGVAKGTFFVHFKTKDGVVVQLIENQTNAARRARDKALAAGGGAIDALRATVLALGKQAGASKTLSRAVLAATLESAEVGGDATKLFEAIYATMLDDARVAKRRGLLLPRVEPERLAWSLLASYLGAVLHFASSPVAPSLLEALTPLVDAAIADAVAPSRAAKAKKRPAKKRASSRSTKR